MINSTRATAHAAQSKATTIKDAIAKFEEKAGAPVASATFVKLINQLPPIEKMDAALSQIAHVESVIWLHLISL